MGLFYFVVIFYSLPKCLSFKGALGMPFHPVLNYLEVVCVNQAEMMSYLISYFFFFF